MPTPEPLVAVLRAPGGERWIATGAVVRDILTSSVYYGDDSADELEQAVRKRRPIAVTSPRAAGWMADLPSSFPRASVYCSGGRTARILASGGWNPLPPLSGSGGDAVATRIISESRGAVLHVCGTETAGTLEAALSVEGRGVDALVVYELRDREAFDFDDVAVLRSCAALAVLAPSCLRVLRAIEPDLAHALSETVPALCGPTTAIALREVGWRDVRVAPEPSPQALLALFLTKSVRLGESP